MIFFFFCHFSPLAVCACICVWFFVFFVFIWPYVESVNKNNTEKTVCYIYMDIFWQHKLSCQNANKNKIVIQPEDHKK